MSGGKAPSPSWKIGDRLGDVLQPVLAEVGERRPLDELGGRMREEDLAAVAGGGDARGEVDVVADVALLGDERRARVQADPHLDRARRERLGHRRGRGERPGARREGEEEGVALRVDLDPALGGARLADHAAVLGERLRVRLGAELVQQLRRALDVGEEEGDGAARGDRAACGPDHARRRAAVQRCT